MASAGRILIIPKGDYSQDITYKMLDLVKHNGMAWLAKKTSVGIEPTEENEEYWHLLIDLEGVEVKTVDYSVNLQELVWNEKTEGIYVSDDLEIESANMILGLMIIECENVLSTDVIMPMVSLEGKHIKLRTNSNVFDENAVINIRISYR